jgi:hypothetical protein
MEIKKEETREGKEVIKIQLSPNLWIKEFKSTGDVILHILFRGKK